MEVGMAQKVTVELEDDLDGGPADGTLRSSAGSWSPSSSMPVRPGEASAAGRRVPHQGVSTAAPSGPGQRSRASRSASAGASRRAFLISMKSLWEGPDAELDHRQRCRDTAMVQGAAILPRSDP